MKWSKSFFLGLLSLSLLAGAGCNWLKPDTPEDGGNVPPPIDDPGINTNRNQGPEDPFGTTGYNEGGKLAAGDMDGWESAPIANWKYTPVYFAYDQSTLGTSEQAKLDNLAAYMKQNPKVGIIIQGNCDERGSEEYNRGLGERRALAVKDYLVGKGVADATLRTISYGKERPADPGHNEAAWVKNRRAEFEAHRILR